ncbi:MAG TPA: class I adenylate-forming enzyme family protein [Candidatus Dormibacteraeota bacterium]|nr:class I adenylate-forming enzyme family protein [Candidatus Dormibacteraeota bacterium]
MTGIPRRFDARSYLAANAVERPEAVAVYDLDRRVSFAELERTVDRLVAALLGSGLRPNEPVGVRLPNRWEYVALELAIPAAGGIIVPLPLTLGEAEMRWAVERSGARRVIQDPDLAALFTGPAEPAPAPGLPASPERIVEIALTSGTTGMPKLAALSAKLKQATFDGFTSRLEVTESDRVLIMSPLTQGIGGMCLFCLRLGAGLIMLHEARFRPETVLELATQLGATMLVGVPTNIVRLLDSPELDGADLGSARLTAVAGAPMPPELAAQWEDRTGSRVCIFYGSMDAGQLSVGRPSDPREKRHQTVGRPHECCEAMITAEGEICMRGDTVQERYWGENFGPHAEDGWVHMGDLGWIDEDGYLQVLGRTKDLVIRGGTKINPHEVEQVLLRHSGIAEACVVGRPDRELGERAVAFLVGPRDVPPPKLEELKVFLAAQGLARYKWPEEVHAVAEIPLSGPGKVDRRTLRTQLLA